MTGFAEAFRQTRTAQRAQNQPRRPRTPILAHLGRLTARALGQAGRARTPVLQLGGLGLVDAAAWRAGTVWGLLVGGAALLFLDWLNGDTGGRR